MTDERDLRWAERLATAVLLMALGVLIWPATLGGWATYVVVNGTSMQPGYQTGDLVVLRRQSTYEVGQVAAFTVPDTDARIIHRITGGDPLKGYVFQGDNRTSPDQWRPVATEVLGRQVLHVPGAGRWLAILRQPVVLGGLFASIVVTSILMGEDDTDTSPRTRRREQPAAT